MCFGCMRKCISPRLPQQHKDGGKERKKGGEKKEKTNMYRNRRDKQPIEKWRERIVKGGKREEEGENRKQCLQIAN